MPRLPDVTALGERSGDMGGSPIADTRGVGADVEGAAISATRQAIRDGGSVGEAAKALEGFAVALGEARKRTQLRYDTIERIRAIQEYEAEGLAELVRLQTEEDYSNQTTADTYINGLKEKRDSLLANHAGTEDSKAILAIDLDERFGAFARQSAEAMIGAQRKRLSDQTSSDINRYAMEAYRAPENLQSILNKWGRQIDGYRGVMTADEELSVLKAGIETIATAGVRRQIDSGEYVEAARSLALVPEGVLSPQTMMNLHRDITLGASQARNNRSAFEDKIKATESALGRPLSEDEILRMSGAAPPREEIETKDPPKPFEVKVGDKIQLWQLDRVTGSYKVLAEADRDLDPTQKLIAALTGKGGMGEPKKDEEEASPPTTKKGGASSVELELAPDGKPIARSQKDYDLLGEGEFWYPSDDGKLIKGRKPGKK